MPLVRSLALAVGLALAAGCGGAPGNPSTGMPELLPRGPLAIGLGYGQAAAIAVELLDERGRPAAGRAVRFALAGDAGGSTLTAQRALTDAAGGASVELAAGAAEASFGVTVSADGAADLRFDVSVSRFPLVSLEAQLAYAGAGMGSVATVRALLYDDRPCARLPPAAMPPTPLRAESASGSSATLRFPLLRDVAYALAGRAEDANGHLIAAGCVDLGRGALSPAGTAVPVPLARVAPSVAGTFAVTATLPAPAAPSPVATWDALAACPLGLATRLLDGMGAQLGSDPLATAIEARRGAADHRGCRPPSLANGAASLDATLELLLAPTGSPGAALPAVVGDLDAIVAGGTLDSTLALSAAGPATPTGIADWLARHALVKASFAGRGGESPVSYDLGALGLPVLAADAVPTRLDGPLLELGPHAFTLRLPLLWGRALADVALGPRRLPTDPASLVTAILAAATRPGDLAGCAAVEDALCAALAAGSCALEHACALAAQSLAAELSAPFAAPSGYDLVIDSGTATVVDQNGDLVAETLAAGSFSVEIALSASRTDDEALAWTATRAH